MPNNRGMNSSKRMPQMSQEVLPGGYWFRPVLWDEFIPVARPSLGTADQEVPADEPPEFPLSAPPERPEPAPLEEPSRTPLEIPPPYRGRRALSA